MQQVESQLLTIAGSAVGAINSRAFSAWFFASGMFGQKLKMTTAAIEHSPAANSLKVRWEQLERCLESASRIRNGFVHGMVYSQQDGTYFIGGDSQNLKNFTKHNTPFGPERRASDLVVHCVLTVLSIRHRHGGLQRYRTHAAPAATPHRPMKSVR